MKKIGRGWQYTIYDVGNGRVLKKYNSKIVGYIHMARVCFPFRTNPLRQIPAYYRGCRETAIDSMKKIPTSTVETWMMGNPRILNALDYEQDKLVPFHDFFARCMVGQGKKAIDDFVVFNKTLVEKKLIDKSFNITKNFGLDKQGRIVLMDLGELYSSDAAIAKQIQNKAWATHYVVEPLQEPLKEYFIQSMNRAFI